MKNKTIAASEPSVDVVLDDFSAACANPASVAQFQRAMRILTGKWKGEILWYLTQRTHRFGELRRSIGGITQHMLTTQLRDLEAHGLVKRTVFPEVPPRVEYELTQAAIGLQPVFHEIMRWAEAHVDFSLDDERPDRAAAPTGRNRSLRA
jgi:DNA-binding HxlR family transcriptional regulator